MLDFAVENYIKTAKGLPFFYITGDDDYLQVQTELVQHGLKTVRMSDFCRKVIACQKTAIFLSPSPTILSF